MSLNKTRKRAIARAKYKQCFRLSPLERAAYRVGQAMLSIGRIAQCVTEDLSALNKKLMKGMNID